MLAAQIFIKVIDLALMLILARILAPTDFALVAMAMIFIQFAETVLEVPVAQALIRTPSLNQRMLDTAFTISILRALIVMVAGLCFAPIAVIIFSEPRLAALIAVLSFAAAFRGVVNPRLVMYARDLNYFPEAILTALAKAIAAAAAIPIALSTGSYWSLVVLPVLTPLMMTIGSFCIVWYRPRFSLKEWPIFSNMIGWTSVSQIFVAANWQADMFIFAQSAPRDLVGKFSVSRQLAGAPFQVFVAPIERPFLAAFSHLGPGKEIQDGYLRASAAIFTLVSPILGLIFAFSDPIVAVLFSEAWTGAALFLKVMVCAVIVLLPTESISSLVLSLDRAKFNAIHAGLGVATKLPLIYFGLQIFGVNGFLAGQFIASVLLVSIGACIVKHLIGLPLLTQLKSYFRAIVGNLVLVSISLFALQFVAVTSNLLLIVVCLAIGAVAFAAYWAVVMAIWFVAGRPQGVEQMIIDYLAMAMRRFGRIGADEATLDATFEGDKGTN